MKSKHFVLNITNTCNLNCIYCFQKNNIQNSKPVTQQDIENMLQIIIKNIDCDKIIITLFGGEPTLAFDNIKFITSSLNYSNIYFKIMTNGTTLNQEYIDFFNDNNFHVTISWDGKNTVQTRGVDIFPSKLKYILQLNDLSVESVLTKYNTPYDTLMALSPYSQEYYKIHNKYLQHNLTPVRGQKDLYPEDYTIWKDDMQKILTSNDKHIISYIVHIFNVFKYSNKSDFNYISENDKKSSCFNDKRQHNICKNCQLISVCPDSIRYEKQHCTMLYETFNPILNQFNKQNWFIN